MPKMDGIVTTRNIRRYDSLTPIVSMTSNFTHNDIMEYIGIGMNDILPKPFSKNTLYDILEKHCAHLKIMQQQQSSSTTGESIIPRGLSLPQHQQPVQSISPMLEEPPNNYPYTTTPNNNSAIIVDTPSTSSTTSSPTNHSPTTTNTDSSYWQPIDNRKLVWSSSSTPSSSSSVQQQKYHPLPPHHHPQPSKRQKLNDLYDPNPPPF